LQCRNAGIEQSSFSTEVVVQRPASYARRRSELLRSDAVVRMSREQSDGCGYQVRACVLSLEFPDVPR